MSNCLVVLSGGVNSTISAAIAKYVYFDNPEDKIHGITFDCGHLTKLESAIAVAKELELDSHEIVDLRAKVLKSISLSVSKNQVEQHDSTEDLPEEIASTFVPCRNQLFLTIAANRAITLETEDVFIGVGQTDSRGYSDCHRDFIDAIEKTIKLGGMGQLKAFGIQTPLMYKTQAESIIMAKETLGARFESVIEKTHNCYSLIKGGCGQCVACFLRDRGFKEAGINDPIWKYRQR